MREVTMFKVLLRMTRPNFKNWSRYMWSGSAGIRSMVAQNIDTENLKRMAEKEEDINVIIRIFERLHPEDVPERLKEYYQRYVVHGIMES